jgi:hypothetical protein
VEAGVVFSEIMYHPVAATNGTSGDLFEFIELYNTGASPVSLTGATFSKGITYTFSSPTTLNSSNRIVVVKDLASFQSRYPGVSNLAVGAYSNQLDNAGEQITLRDSGGTILCTVTYGTAAPWPASPDGLGSSLVLLNPLGDLNAATNWVPNSRYNGNPGLPDTGASVDVVINEVLSHTDPPQEDAIELISRSTNAIDLTGWYLSDDPAWPDKYRIASMVIPAQGYAVFYQCQFNDTNSLLASNNVPFSLSSHGDEVILSQPSASNSFRLVDVVNFGAAQNGYSFGRYPDGSGALIPLATVTFGTTNPPNVEVFRTGGGAPNSLPRIGPLVISEIMYNPASGLAEDEYIELLNVTTNTVPLHDPLYPSNTWTVASGVSFIFPTNVSLGAGERLLVTGATNIPAFRLSHGLSTNIQVYGGWTGRLSDSGETIELYKPDTPDLGLVPYILVDRVDYLPTAPWPTGANGYGPSLERSVSTNYGNSVSNWFTGAPGGSPGTASAGGFVNPLLSPVLPLPGQAFTATVAVVAQSLPTQVVVRTVIGGVTNVQEMTDNGLNGDQVASDRTYTAVIGGQPGGTWVYYSFVASLAGSNIFSLPVNTWFNVLVGAAPPDVVISEIMYHPAQTNAEAYEYVELFNTSGSTFDLSGWTLSGAAFTLPAGTLLAGNSRIVCCASTNTIAAFYGITNVVGNWLGVLQDGGETLSLVNQYGRTVDSVKYDDKEPWPGAADGFGPSLERYSMAGSANTSLNWSASCASTNWQQVAWTGQLGGASSPLRFFLDFDGRCYLDDVSVKAVVSPTELVANGNFESGMTGWAASNTHSQSRIESGQGRGGGAALGLQCNEGRWILDNAPYSITFYGDTGSNNVASTPLATQAGTNYVVSWWVKRAGVSGTAFCHVGGVTNSLVLSHFGTPGRTNSIATDYLPLGITSVSQTYSICPVGTANVIRAQVSPPAAGSVRVHYQVLSTNGYRFTNLSYSNAVMSDDGLAPDSLAGDGNYAVYMPIVAANWSLVRYHVQATATNGFLARSPRLDDPSTDYGYWVQSSSPQTNLPNWHLIVDGDPILYPVSRHLCAISPDGQVFTDISARHRGNPDSTSPQRSGVGLEFHRTRSYDAWFAPDQGGINLRHRLNNSPYYYRRVVAEPLAYELQRIIGLPTPRLRHVCAWMNGFPTITTELEDPGEDFLSGNGLSLNDYVSRQTYGHGRNIVAGNPALDNFSSIESMLYSLNSSNRNAYIRTNLCYESIQHCLGLLSLTGDGDQAFDWNMFQHRSATDGRWRQYPWDVDICFDLAFSKSWTALTNLHPYYRTPAHPSIWSTNSFDSLARPLFYPETNDVTTLPYRYRHQMTLWRHYYTLYTTNVLFSKLDAIQSQLVPSYVQINAFSPTSSTLGYLVGQVTNVKTFIVSRRSYYMNTDWSDKMTNVWGTGQAYNPSNVVVSEIMHTPASGGKYIELFNRGSQYIDLSYWLLRSGDFTARLPFGTMLAPNDYLVLVEAQPLLAGTYGELAAPGTMTERYPGTGLWDWPIVFTSATEYASRIVEIPGLKVPDAGTTIELRDILSNLIESVAYTNVAPWPAAVGVSLERINLSSSNSSASAWRASTLVGSPGTLNTATADQDLDGMPDALEQQIMAASGGEFSEISQVLSGDDFDEDGIINLDEFLLGTSPVVPDGALARLDIATTNGGFRVSFPAIPATGGVYQAYSGRYYTLFSTPALSPAVWSAVVNYSNLMVSGFVSYTNAPVLPFEAYRFKAELRPLRQ